jgi:2-polyprenyl-3-methyl-5-hydroxy-6-metoxy-1,4-benzoquinol methylase
MKYKELIVSLINQLKLPILAMHSRTLVRWYFHFKYRKEDPYAITTRYSDTRYGDMMSLVEKRHFRRALDVGCGEGVFSEMLLKVCDSVDGIDISDNAVNRAKTKYHSIPNLNFSIQDILKAPLDFEYDLIVCAEILYYLNKKQLLEVIRRISTNLKIGGYLLVCNIKQIHSSVGFFRNHIGANEINEAIIAQENYEIITSLDRGGDILMLLKRHK